jgi:hypothetical protein
MHLIHLAKSGVWLMPCQSLWTKPSYSDQAVSGGILGQESIGLLGDCFADKTESQHTIDINAFWNVRVLDDKKGTAYIHKLYWKV